MVSPSARERFSHVPQFARACSHALLKLGREGSERFLWHSEGFQSLEAECHSE